MKIQNIVFGFGVLHQTAAVLKNPIGTEDITDMFKNMGLNDGGKAITDMLKNVGLNDGGKDLNSVKDLIDGVNKSNGMNNGILKTKI